MSTKSTFIALLTNLSDPDSASIFPVSIEVESKKEALNLAQAYAKIQMGHSWCVVSVFSPELITNITHPAEEKGEIKQAFLATFHIMTRVVVDMKGKTPEELEEAIAAKGVKAIRKGVLEDKEYPYTENLECFEPDFEIPFGTAPEDHQEEETE